MAERNWTERTLDTNSDIWDREEPIEGKLIKTESNIGPNGSKMYTFEVEDKEIKVWGTTVLDDKLLGVPVGTYVRIDYEGKLKSKKGTPYHSYKVFIDEDSIPQEAPQDFIPEDTDEPISLDQIPF